MQKGVTMETQYLDWPWKPMDTIPVDHELNTLLRLNPEFPLAVSHDNLSSYQNHFVNWHKQGSIEISVVKEGAVTVNLLNHQEHVAAGNPKQKRFFSFFHDGFSDSTAC